jgi:hypothetical protein
MQIGVSVLLNRLKQDVVTAKELAGIFKKRAIVEDEYGKCKDTWKTQLTAALQKLAKGSQETLKRLEVKQQYVQS